MHFKVESCSIWVLVSIPEVVTALGTSPQLHLNLVLIQNSVDSKESGVYTISGRGKVD